MISWSTAVRDLRNDRSRRAGVREERLRATVGLRGAASLSSWRGRSGRRYVVGVHALSEGELMEVTDAVVIAVRRDRDGVAEVVDLATAGALPKERTRAAWVKAVRVHGATEIHLHRLASGEDERLAIIDDLRDDEADDEENRALAS